MSSIVTSKNKGMSGNCGCLGIQSPDTGEPQYSVRFGHLSEMVVKRKYELFTTLTPACGRRCRDCRRRLGPTTISGFPGVGRDWMLRDGLRSRTKIGRLNIAVLYVTTFWKNQQKWSSFFGVYALHQVGDVEPLPSFNKELLTSNWMLVTVK